MVMARGIRASVGSRIFDALNYLLLGLLGIVTVGPFIYIILGSLTESAYYKTVGVSVLPTHWSLATYEWLLLRSSRIYQSLKVTLFVTVVGTALNLLVTAALAYGISKTELPGRRFFLLFVFATMMFGGGMIPFYLVTKWVGLLDTVWAMIVPGLVSAWNMFIMIKFFDSLPADLEDSARIDGCSEIGIFWRIVLPLSKPVLATVGLFYAVDHWNDWFWPMIFLTETKLFPLQLVLRGVLNSTMLMQDPNVAIDVARWQMRQPPPPEVMNMGAIVVTVLPIALVYPFLQKYFVKGVLVGAIKG